MKPHDNSIDVHCCRLSSVRILQGVLDVGLATHPQDASLEALQQRLATARSSAQRAGRGATHGRASTRGMTEREHAEMMQPKESILTAEKLSLSNNFLDMVPGGRDQALRRILGDAGKGWPEIPPFHDEIAKAGNWPAQCDIGASQSKVCGSPDTRSSMYYPNMGVHVCGYTGEVVAFVYGYMQACLALSRG